MYPYDSDRSYEAFAKKIIASTLEDVSTNENIGTEEPAEDVPVMAQEIFHGKHGGHDRHDRDGQRHRQPFGAPPSYTPHETGSLHAVDPRAIMRCVNSFTYVWLMHGRGFWMYPTFVGPRSVAGYRWGRFGWTYTGFDIRAVKSFTCSPSH